MRRLRRIIGAIVEFVDVVKWALRERKRWRPPEDADEE